MFQIGSLGLGGKTFGFNIKTLGEISIPRLATGGFPEDGLFMANSRELVGKFSNGKTAVANNMQIIEGIKRGVQEGIAEMNKSLRNTREINYNAVKREILKQNQSNVNNSIVEQIAEAVTQSLRNAEVNVNIEAKTEEGVIVNKVVKADREHLMQTGQPLFGY